MTELVWWKRGETKTKKTKTIKRKRSKEKKTRRILKKGKSKPKKTKTIPKRKKEEPLLSSFEYFDPKQTNLLQFNLTGLYGIAKRTWQILADRGRKEVDGALHEISEMLAAVEIEKSIKKAAKSYTKPTYYSYARILREQIDSRSIGGKDKLPNAAWPEYFAIMALVLIEHAFHRYDLNYSCGIRHVPLTKGKHIDDKNASQSFELIKEFPTIWCLLQTPDKDLR